MRGVGKCNATFFIGTRIRGAFTTTHYPLKNSAILDSGTTLHIFNQISRFINFHTAPKGDFVYAGEHQVPILGYGDVDIEIKTRTEARILRLHDVAFCENFACNLVSLRQLRKRGIWWDTRPGQNNLRQSDNSVLCELVDRFDQYVIEDIPEEIVPSAFHTRRNKFNSWTQKPPNKADALKWHLRLGHPGPQALEHLVNCSKGAKIKGIRTVECDDCGVAKAKRQIRREPRELDEGPGLRIAIDFHDIDGDEDGYRSVMLITDRWSGYTWDFYLSTRTAEALIATLDLFLNLLKKQYNLEPNVIECDGELTKSFDIRRYVEVEKKMRLEPSAPDTQSQNGGAERSGGTVKTKARAMRAGAKLPAHLWKEIYQAAVYLYNRTPKYMYRWTTPYDRFHTYLAHRDGVVVENRRPYQAHLRVYGCKAFAMTKDALRKEKRRQRLNPRAWIGYLIGYNSTNIYRIWNPITGKVIATRDVIFNEDAVFDGNLDTLKDDALHIGRQELIDLLEEIEVHLKGDQVLDAGTETLPQGEDVDAFEEPTEWLDAGAEIATQAEIASQTVDDMVDGQQSGAVSDQPCSYTDARPEPYPSPAPTPPAALLAASIQSPEEDHHQPEDREIYGLDSRDVWMAAFSAGRLACPVGVLKTEKIDKAKLLRLLKKPHGLHRSQLPAPPRHHGELATHPMGHLFEEAQIAHLESHKQMRSWMEVPRTHAKDKQVLDCMWVYVYKFDKHGRFKKCKARLVVRGDQQAKSIHENTYASTLAGRSFRTLMAIAARFDLELLQYDAVNAFVNADLKQDIYMRMPPGFRKTGLILKLLKALYGSERVSLALATRIYVNP